MGQGAVVKPQIRKERAGENFRRNAGTGRGLQARFTVRRERELRHWIVPALPLRRTLCQQMREEDVLPVGVICAGFRLFADAA